MKYLAKRYLRRILPDSVWWRIVDHPWTQKLVSANQIDYTPITEEQLLETLKKLGIERGDLLLVHSSFDKFRGMEGGVFSIIRALFDAVGEEGTVMMPTFPMGSMQTVLKDRVFDARRSPSEMGLVTEVFRRLNGVRRSDHPYHSVAAKGPLAEWIVEDHSKSSTPFGPETPFGRLVVKKGKVLLLGVELQHGMTLVHVVEDMMGNDFPVSVYLNEPMAVKIVDGEGLEKTVYTKVHDDKVYSRMDIPKIKKYLIWDKALQEERISRAKIYLLDADRLVKCLVGLARQGITVY